MRRIKQISVFLALLTLMSSLGAGNASAVGEVDGKRITSLGAIVIDFETGMEIYAYNADVRRGPASMTKMMTVYLVYEAMANGMFDMDTIVPISPYVSNYSRTPGETNVPLNQGVDYTVSELLDVIVVMSAGGACAALAELVAGTTRAFIKSMNEKAQEWGIDAIFYSVSGGVNFTQLTPRAMAELARRMIMDFPEVLEKTSMPTVTFRGRTIPSTNNLLGVYEGIDGLKTGTHSGTRANFTGTAKRGDIRIISVTMGSSNSGRFADTTILLDYGFEVMEAYWQAIEARKVAPRITPVLVDGIDVGFETFDIEGERYFNIRDLSFTLNGTDAQFDVVRDAESNTLEIIGGKPYSAVGGEMADRGGEKKLPEFFDSSIIINGEEVSLRAYDIEGDIYMQITDLNATLGFDVIWRGDGVSYVMLISTGAEPPPVEEPVTLDPLPPFVLPIVTPPPIITVTPSPAIPEPIDDQSFFSLSDTLIIAGSVIGACCIAVGLFIRSKRRG